MSKPHPMVLAAARALSDRQAAACEVDAEDMWKTYPDVFLEDAEAALKAAGSLELLEALEWTARALDADHPAAIKARAAIAKSGGPTK